MAFFIACLILAAAAILKASSRVSKVKLAFSFSAMAFLLASV